MIQLILNYYSSNRTKTKFVSRCHISWYDAFTELSDSEKISGPLSKIELELVGRILMKTNCLPGHKGKKVRPSKKRRI